MFSATSVVPQSGSSNLRWYHTVLMLGSMVTPEAALLGQNGTVIVFGQSSRCHHRSRMPTLAGSGANAHAPLRLSQWSRLKMGRGYSGLGFMIPPLKSISALILHENSH